MDLIFPQCFFTFLDFLLCFFFNFIALRIPLFNLFQANVSFLYPLKTLVNSIFLRFQGVWKWNIGEKRVKVLFMIFSLNFTVTILFVSWNLASVETLNQGCCTKLLLCGVLQKFTKAPVAKLFSVKLQTVVTQYSRVLWMELWEIARNE